MQKFQHGKMILVMKIWRRIRLWFVFSYYSSPCLI